MHEQTLRKPWKMHRRRMSGTSETGQHWCQLFVPGSPPKRGAKWRECMETDLGGLGEERKCQHLVWHRVGQGRSIGFSHCGDQIVDKKQHKGGRLWGPQFEGIQSIMADKTAKQSGRNRRLTCHIPPVFRKKGDVSTSAQLAFSFVCNPKLWSMQCCCPHLG